MATKLKGVYKAPDHNFGITSHFVEWFERTQTGLQFNFRSTYKVSLAWKDGKRKRLKKRIVSFHLGGCGVPQCCGRYYEIHFREPNPFFREPKRTPSSKV